MIARILSVSALALAVSMSSGMNNANQSNKKDKPGKAPTAEVVDQELTHSNLTAVQWSLLTPNNAAALRKSMSRRDRSYPEFIQLSLEALSEHARSGEELIATIVDTTTKLGRKLDGQNWVETFTKGAKNLPLTTATLAWLSSFLSATNQLDESSRGDVISGLTNIVKRYPTGRRNVAPRTLKFLLLNAMRNLNPKLVEATDWEKVLAGAKVTDDEIYTIVRDEPANRQSDESDETRIEIEGGVSSHRKSFHSLSKDQLLNKNILTSLLRDSENGRKEGLFGDKSETVLKSLFTIIGLKRSLANKTAWKDEEVGRLIQDAISEGSVMNAVRDYLISVWKYVRVNTKDSIELETDPETKGSELRRVQTAYNNAVTAIDSFAEKLPNIRQQIEGSAVYDQDTKQELKDATAAGRKIIENEGTLIGFLKECGIHFVPLKSGNESLMAPVRIKWADSDYRTNRKPVVGEMPRNDKDDPFMQNPMSKVAAGSNQSPIQNYVPKSNWTENKETLDKLNKLHAWLNELLPTGGLAPREKPKKAEIIVWTDERVLDLITRFAELVKVGVVTADEHSRKINEVSHKAGQDLKRTVNALYRLRGDWFTKILLGGLDGNVDLEEFTNNDKLNTTLTTLDNFDCDSSADAILRGCQNLIAKLPDTTEESRVELKRVLRSICDGTEVALGNQDPVTLRKNLTEKLINAAISILDKKDPVMKTKISDLTGSVKFLLALSVDDNKWIIELLKKHENTLNSTGQMLSESLKYLTEC